MGKIRNISRKIRMVSRKLTNLVSAEVPQHFCPLLERVVPGPQKGEVAGKWVGHLPPPVQVQDVPGVGEPWEPVDGGDTAGQEETLSPVSRVQTATQQQQGLRDDNDGCSHHSRHVGSFKRVEYDVLSLFSFCLRAGTVARV